MESRRIKEPVGLLPGDRRVWQIASTGIGIFGDARDSRAIDASIIVTLITVRRLDVQVCIRVFESGTIIDAEQSLIDEPVRHGKADAFIGAETITRCALANDERVAFQPRDLVERTGILCISVAGL